jgi:predicted lipid-binding transport protein (Tim44 family)
VDQVVVGSVTLKSISLGQKRHVLEVEFDANRTRNIEGQAPKREVCLETWRFERDFQAKSAPPAKLRVLTCPACGAPANVTDAGVCAHCGDVVQAGLQAWAVASIEVKVRKAFDTSGLGETVAERGTWNDTVVDPELSSQGRRVARGSFKPFFATFERDVVRPTFTAMYAAWSSLKWDEVRHLLGDRLWESQAFWMAQYREKGLSNRLEKLDIQRVEPVRAEQDADLEALTVRIFVRGLDYTVDSQGTVIGGDPSWPREFTEYWVFVRTRGARERGGAHVEPRCPNCGAPLDQMSAAGICGHCDVKVTCGDHGWVLTQIIQDESYVG